MEVTSKNIYEKPSDSRMQHNSYSRARVKLGVCRDYPRAVLVQVVLALFAVGDVYASLCKKASCPKIQTNSRPARRDVSDCEVSRLGWQ